MRPCAIHLITPHERLRAHTRAGCRAPAGVAFPLSPFRRSAAVKVLDIRHCSLLSSIYSVRNCTELTRIQMGATMVSDLGRCLGVFVRAGQ
jgi:hypothetical protein